MKKLLPIAALMIVISPFAQAQVHFGPGSARPINPQAATRDLDRQLADRSPAKAPQKPRRTLVECRDGSMHIAQVCRRHGGVARR
jgi:hypothetical protein